MKSIKVSPDTELHPPWQGTMLAWLCIFQTFFTLMTFLFLLKLAYEGFKAGEMGIMIGIFGIIFLVFLFPLLILMIIITIGVFKEKRWTLILLLVVTCISLLVGFFSLVAGPVIFLGVMLFLGLMLWTEIICLKSTYYRKIRKLNIE
ncbi:MAG: hypothetical protein IMY71_15580 [Bacteroidetes bacterium]|nr:hypothetical protein [Bacteroidota bacterium]